MENGWLLFCQIFAAVGLFLLLLRVLPLPFFERNGTTIMCATRAKQVAVARTLAAVIGNPTCTLDTEGVKRFLFADGTSVDWLVHAPSFQVMYEVVALKQVVLGLFSLTSPIRLAVRMRDMAEDYGFKAQVVSRPDFAFQDGKTVLVFTSACQSNGSGSGFIIRKNGFRVGGQRPTRFTGWPLPTQEGLGK